MKKIYLSILAITLFISGGFAQTVLFSENFNTGTTTQFTLNTTDLSSAGTQAVNQWVINNAYDGTKDSGMFNCNYMGIGVFQFPYVITAENTPNQPSSITGNPHSPYLHILDTLARNININTADFTNADSACVYAQNSFVKMNAGVNTTGLNGVSLSFWWTCFGATVAYGEVYYSTNGGTTWTLITNPISKYYNDSTWQQQTIAMQQFDNVADLRFGFMWVNRTYSSGPDLDPAFSIDDISISYSTTGIQEAFKQSTKIYPNPASTSVTVQSGQVIKQITVSNALGQLYSTMDVSAATGKNITVNLPSASGLYFIHITGENADFVSKVVKE